MQAIVCSLDKQQLLELAGDLLLLAKGNLEHNYVGLGTSKDIIVICTPDNFSEVCNELEQELTEEDTEVYP